MGQFISEDPIGFRAGDANLYRYVFNGSPNYTDPSGNNALSDAYRDFLTSDLTHDLASRYDQFFAGFGDAATFGATTKLREWRYGNRPKGMEAAIYCHLGPKSLQQLDFINSQQFGVIDIYMGYKSLKVLIFR